MDFENSNFLFDPENWFKLRSEGKNKFIFFPVIVLLISSGLFFYFLKGETKGDIIRSGFFTLVLSTFMYVSRLTTWHWKEYKYKRHANAVTSYTKVDLVISIANIVRVLSNIIMIIYLSFFVFI